MKENKSVIRVLNIAPLNIGGMQTTIMNYYRNLDKNKIQFDFLSVHKGVGHGYYEDEVHMLGGRVFHIYYSRENLLFDFSFHRAFMRFLKNNPEIKIIHIHGGSPARTSIFGVLSMISGLPIRIIHSRGAQGTFPFFVSIFRPLARYCATHWLGCSTEAGQSLFGKKAWDNSNKTFLFENARDLEQFRFKPQQRTQKREELGIDNQFVVLHVSRLDPIKNQILLLDALAHAVKVQPNILLLMAGDGVLRNALEDKVNYLCLNDHVRFLGMRNDVPELLQAADLFVLPSISEGLPGVAIEAQATGLPCLLADTISPEAKVTNLVEFLPINKGAFIWGDYMLRYENFERQDTLDDVRRAGYDSRDAAKKLENFYFDILKGKG